MKTKISELTQETLRLIKDPAVVDPAIIAKLGPLPAKLNGMQKDFDRLEDEAERIAVFLKEVSEPQTRSLPEDEREDETPPQAFGSNGRRPHQKLRIEINWHALGKPRDKQIISEYKAVDSLVRFVIELRKAYGNEVLEKLSKLTINRGPFVSKTPQRDYWNQAKEEAYQYQTVTGSDFAILTTNSTAEKVQNIQNACRFLGLRAGAVKVEAVDKFQEYEL